MSAVNVGHFGHGHFGLGRFGLDISATDVLATEKAIGGRFSHNHKLWVGVCACIKANKYQSTESTDGDGCIKAFKSSNREIFSLISFVQPVI